MTTHTYYNKFWYTHSDFYAEVNLTTEQNNKYHGPAVYTNYYNGIHFAKSMGFKVAYCWNFDMNISTETPLIKARTALQSKEAFINAYTAEEGPCLRTVWFAIKTDFFTTKFPQITNEQEYNTWVKNVGSESNGLENLWHHTLKRESHQLSTISEQDFYDLFTGCSINTNSQVEYATVLPIENNSEEAIIWYYASNMTDSRMLNVLVNDVVIDTVAITSNTAYHKRIRLVETYNVKFEIIDKFTNEIVSTKLIKLTGEYIQNKLKHNGIFKV